MNKFPPRIWARSEHLSLTDVYQEIEINRTFLVSTHAIKPFNNEFMSMTEHQYIVSDLQRKIEVLRGTLEKYRFICAEPDEAVTKFSLAAEVLEQTNDVSYGLQKPE